ncbi:MAG: glycosyltransferase family 2 protein [Selenomonadaceae bacterium]|nr:glycosyltransferase family 2 protein [Selenomonadaceae bacterium]
MNITDTQTKVSIVVPIYRIESYITTCIDSILGQTYKNMEIILVDDGSDDYCPKICDNYVSHDTRVHVIHKKNGGLTSARKAGICHATGEYVLYVDGDDWLEPDYVEKMVEPLKKEKVDIVGNTSIYMNYSDGRQIERAAPMRSGWYRGAEIISKIYPNYISEDKFYDAPLSTNLYLYLFRRDFLVKIQMQVEDEIAMGEDMALTFRAFLNASSFAVINYPGYHYRQHPNSMIHKIEGDHFQRINLLYKNMKRAVTENKNVERKKTMAKKIPNGVFFTLWVSAPIKFAEISDSCLFPFSQVIVGSKVFVYGMGVVGRGIMEAVTLSKKFFLVGCSDEGWRAYADGVAIGDKFCPVYSPEKIKECDFDYVVIGVSRYRFRKEIEKVLIKYGIPENKIATPDQYLLIEENIPF